MRRANFPRGGAGGFRAAGGLKTKTRTMIVVVLLILSAGAGVGLGCGWNGFENSVRFNLWTSERARLRLPPLSDGGDEEDGEVWDYHSAEQANSAAWRGAEQAAASGEWKQARALLREFVERGWGDRWNSAVDQLDALSALDAGSDAESVRAYLKARREFDARVAAIEAAKANAAGQPSGDSCDKPAEPAPEAAAGPPTRDPNLADNFAYLRAAMLYHEGQAGEAAEAFRALVSKYPRSEKREAALYMAARAELSRSRAYLGPEETATSEDACPDCRDDAWRAARAGFSRQLAEHPRGRLADEARGWLAYLGLRVGDVGGALTEYYRMLADEDEGAKSEALQSLRLARGRARESDMLRVEEELSDEPRAALAYAYHDIYNYTLSYYFTIPDLDPAVSYAGCFGPYRDGCDGWKQEQADDVKRRAERTGLARVARFAARMMERHPGAQAGGAFTVRVAEANLEMGETETALKVARRALASGVSGTERDAAAWVAGVAEYQRRDLAAARRTLGKLAADSRDDDVNRRARVLLAVASEEAGDLDAALEQYLALNYEADVAYFMDVLMTVEQLVSFVDKHREHPRRDELRYALGVRLLRARRYRDAREMLSSVRTTAEQSPSLYDRYGDDEPEEPKLRFRRYFYFEEEWGTKAGRESRVSAEWVLRDLKTAEDLERLERAGDAAVTFEEKAEALYQLASYLYQGSNLKFYNPAAWGGGRAEMMASLDEGRFRAPGEAETLWRHAREHEPVARALEIYLDIVRRYPQTKAAPAALYTAVLCHEQLAEYNSYWREAYALGLHAGERLVTYADLERAYPRYRLPAAGRWEPSTRTVDGRPAWPKPPAPKKLTGTERLRRKVRRAEALAVRGWDIFGEVAGGRARRWSLALLCAAGLLWVWRATRRSRSTLYELLRQCAARRSTPPAVVARPSSSYASHQPYTADARLRASAANLGRTLLEVALDERGRAALAINLLTHGLLTVLLWVLLRALRAG